MKRILLAGGLMFLTGLLLSLAPVRADDPASLEDVHKTLLQAAGYQADAPPSPQEQAELLHSALKMLHTVPHVYRGQLREASRLINSALDELSTGDAAHKARQDIFDADDAIKSVMN